MIDKTTYRIFTDKIVYKPKSPITLTKAIENAGEIACFENKPVDVYVNGKVIHVWKQKVR